MQETETLSSSDSCKFDEGLNLFLQTGLMFVFRLVDFDSSCKCA